MKEKELSQIISDLEMANFHLYELSQVLCFEGENKERFDKAYGLVKSSIKMLNQEEIRLEVDGLSDLK